MTQSAEHWEFCFLFHTENILQRNYSHFKHVYAADILQLDEVFDTRINSIKHISSLQVKAELW